MTRSDLAALAGLLLLFGVAVILAATPEDWRANAHAHSAWRAN